MIAYPAGSPRFWIGHAEDGGYIGYAVPGAREIPRDLRSVFTAGLHQPHSLFKEGFADGLS